MKYAGGEVNIDGVYFGDLTTNLQPILEKMAIDTLKIMIHDNPPLLGYNLEGDTAKIEVAFDVFSDCQFIYFIDNLSVAIENAIDLHRIQSGDGWLDDDGKKEIIKIRDDLQKNLDYVNKWLVKEPK